MSEQIHVLPKPQVVEQLGAAPVILGAPGQPDYKIELDSLSNEPVVLQAVKLLRACLSGLLVGPEREDAAVTVQLGLAQPPADLPNAAQGYEIRADAQMVSLRGYGPLGLFYAVQTFCQIVRVQQNDVVVPAVRIQDWPDMATRGHFVESRYGSNLMTLADWQAVVDNMAEMKMNHLIVSVYGCWCVQYDGRVSEYLYVPFKQYEKLQTPVVTRYYSAENEAWVEGEQLPPMFEQDFFGDLVAYGKARAVTVLPLFNSFGHNTLIPAQYPEVSAKDKDGEPTLTGFCTANPQTYEMLFAMYDHIVDNYLLPNGVDSFHIGLDEVGDGIAQNSQDIKRVRSPWCQCEKCAGHDRSDLFIRHAIRLMLHLKEKGMKHIYMYSDMLIPHGTYSTKDYSAKMQMAILENNLEKEAVIDWWTYSDEKDKLMFQSTRPEQGLRRTVKPWNGYYHWTVLSHPLRNIYLLAEIGYKEQVEGMLSYSAWDLSFDRNNAAQASFAWNFQGSGDLDAFRKAYVENRFSDGADNAFQAFDLLEKAASSQNGKQADGTPLINRLSLLQHEVSYYFYSYVRADRPYPRCYPGEALEKLATNKATYRSLINELAALSEKARDLFMDLSRQTGKNRGLAARYAYEADHYLCLCEDFLALLTMLDESQKLATEARDAAIGKIHDLAACRRSARLALMYQLEKTKEAYLLPSHMRNHSIMLMYFTDLLAYLDKTDPSDVKLDFLDNTHFASSIFLKLR